MMICWPPVRWSFGWTVLLELLQTQAGAHTKMILNVKQHSTSHFRKVVFICIWKFPAYLSSSPKFVRQFWEASPRCKKKINLYLVLTWGFYKKIFLQLFSWYMNLIRTFQIRKDLTWLAWLLQGTLIQVSDMIFSLVAAILPTGLLCLVFTSIRLL